MTIIDNEITEHPDNLELPTNAPNMKEICMEHGLVDAGKTLTDKDRWELCGKPDCICADNGDGDHCYHIWDENDLDVVSLPRVCEICGRDEPANYDGDICPDCKTMVWFVPKCPKCGGPGTWTYGEIKPLEFSEIVKAKEDE